MPSESTSVPPLVFSLCPFCPLPHVDSEDREHTQTWDATQITLHDSVVFKQFLLLVLATFAPSDSICSCSRFRLSFPERDDNANRGYVLSVCEKGGGGSQTDREGRREREHN